MVKKIKLITILFFLFCSTGCERGWIWILLDDTFDVEISYVWNGSENVNNWVYVEIWKGKSDTGDKMKRFNIGSGGLMVWENVEEGNYFIRASFSSGQIWEDIRSLDGPCTFTFEGGDSYSQVSGCN